METFNKGWFNVGPASQTLAQHWTNLCWTPGVCWDMQQHTLGKSFYCTPPEVHLRHSVSTFIAHTERRKHLLSPRGGLQKQLFPSYGYHWLDFTLVQWLNAPSVTVMRVNGWTWSPNTANVRRLSNVCLMLVHRRCPTIKRLLNVSCLLRI